MSGAVAVVLVVCALAVVVATVLVQRQATARVRTLVRRLDPLTDVPRRASLRHALTSLSRAVDRSCEGAESREADLARLTTAADALPLGVVVADENGSVVFRNSVAGHFAGTHHADALVLDGVAGTLREASGPGANARERTLELYGPPRRTVVLRAAPFSGGALVVIEDVSERSRVEAMRRDFVANISHELKTPIGALALLAETLIGEDEPDVARRLSERMVTEAHRVGRIIDDLLELSRIEAGEPPLREPVSVGLIAAEAFERVRQLSADRDIEVAIDLGLRTLSVRGDRRQLVSALANLIENGVKYSDPGSRVEVTATADRLGGCVDIAVQDHGIGIPQRDLERVFERFYRVDRARARETGGTGLGLAIVRHVATNHGGAVNVQSQEGIGSTFILRLPAGPGSRAAPADRETSRS